jgi:hypothetical protein
MTTYTTVIIEETSWDYCQKKEKIPEMCNIMCGIANTTFKLKKKKLIQH